MGVALHTIDGEILLDSEDYCFRFDTQFIPQINKKNRKKKEKAPNRDLMLFQRIHFTTSS